MLNIFTLSHYESIKLTSKHIQKQIIWKVMSVENQDCFRMPCGVVVPNFQLYVIRMLVISPIYSLEGLKMA